MVKSMRYVGVAVVGLGNVGRRHLEAIKELGQEDPRIRLVAVMDVLKQRVDEYSSKYGCRGYYTYEEVVRDPEIDVVILATPHYLHAQQAIYAMEFRKHVIVEKPMAITIASAREMVKRAERNGVKLGVVYQRRYGEGVGRVMELVRKGVLGEIFLMDGELMWWRGAEDYFLKDEIAKSWRGLHSTEGGGLLMTQAIHIIDLFIFFAGEAEEVYGYIDNFNHSYIDVEDTAVATIRFRKRALATLTASISLKPSSTAYWRLRVFCSKGWAEIENEKLTQLHIEGATQQPIQETKKENLHKKLLKDFLTNLLEDRDFPINGREGLKSLEIVKAIYYSTTVKQPIKLPLTIETVI